MPFLFKLLSAAALNVNLCPHFSFEQQSLAGNSESLADSVVDALLGIHPIWNQKIKDGILLVN